MIITQYLHRIGYQDPASPDLACLQRLHRCHVMTIPFEAMDVQLGREIKLDLDHIYHKVVIQKRGGYCYELNYLFYSLLSSMGFDCWMVSSRIYNNDILGPPFDHMSLVVQLNELWLVDVGYGDLFIEPLRVKYDGIQEDQFKDYKIERIDESEDFILKVTLKGSSSFIKRYTFDLTPRNIEDFAEQNTFKQSSSDSYFVQNTICTLPTSSGRKTILNDVFKVRDGKSAEEKMIIGDKELKLLLKEEFGVIVD